MNLRFDLVRIGETRKNYNSEKLIELNTELLIKNIRNIITNEKNKEDNFKFEMTIIVPEKGHNIKILMESIKDLKIKGLLKQKFPNSIYKGEIETVLDNIHNKVFR
tara:strand:- start:3110 stop:3427 length:318 start_codon:yes stop_codon:yes gene_type:complete